MSLKSSVCQRGIFWGGIMCSPSKLFVTSFNFFGLERKSAHSARKQAVMKYSRSVLRCSGSHYKEHLFFVHQGSTEDALKF